MQKDVSPIAWVIALNLKRRHLSPGQRATIALEATPLLAAEAKKHQRLGGDSSTFLKNEKPRVSKPIAVEKTVAKQFDVSQGYVHAVKKIREADEKVYEQVKSGLLSIPEAKKELRFKQSVKVVVDGLRPLSKMTNLMFPKLSMHVKQSRN